MALESSSSYGFPGKVRRFLYRHRRKLIFTGVFVGGVVASVKYMQYRIQKWVLEEQQRYMKELQKQQHYSKTQEHCYKLAKATAFSVQENIETKFDTIEITSAIKNETDMKKKLELWNDLKISIFTKMVSCIYVTTISVAILRIQLNHISAKLFCKTSQDITKSGIDDNIRQWYLGQCHNFLSTSAIDDIAKQMKMLTESLTDSMPLQCKMGGVGVQSLLKSYHDKIKQHSMLKFSPKESDDSSCIVDYFLPCEPCVGDSSVEAKQVLSAEIWDIVDTDDFMDVINSCVSSSFEVFAESISLEIMCSRGYGSGAVALVGDHESIMNNKCTLPLAKLLPVVNSKMGTVSSQSYINHVLNCMPSIKMAVNSKSLLSGIRVVDMTRVLAGPFMTMILGDMGADVIKVEKPKDGDDTRSWGPPFRGTESAYFLSTNRNKRSIAINMKHKKGIGLIKDMVKVSDVFVENYVPGKLDSIGIGYEELEKVNPGLVYCSITGFGPAGPYAKRPGYDVIAASYGGLNYITGPENGEPCKVGVALTDLCTGLYAHGAIIAALMQREKSGLGQKIDCDLLSTQLATLVNISSNYLNNGVEAKRWGTAHASLVPYQAFETKNSHYLTVGATTNRQFEDLCGKLGVADLAKDERFASNKDRVENRVVLLEILGEIFLSKTNAEWLQVFEGSAFPYGPVNNMEQAFSDPHVIFNNLVHEYEHPTAGSCKITAPPVKYTRHSYPRMKPPPTLGQHTSEILQGILHLSDNVINDLYHEGVVA